MQTPKVEDSRSVVIPQTTGRALDFLSQYEPFTPILDRVLIRRLEDKQTTGLSVPDKFRQATNKGEVLGVGELVKSNLKPGDLVLFGEYSAERFNNDGEELWLVREANIRGVKRLKIPAFQHSSGCPGTTRNGGCHCSVGIPLGTSHEQK